jgi:hypothetical protein
VIEQDRSLLGESRFLDVSYEELCDDPHRTLGDVARFADGVGAKLEHRRDVPARFERPSRVSIEPELYERLVEYAAGRART